MDANSVFERRWNSATPDRAQVLRQIGSELGVEFEAMLKDNEIVGAVDRKGQRYDFKVVPESDEVALVTLVKGEKPAPKAKDEKA